MASLKQLAIKGAVWTIAGYGLSQILRFGSNLILTRLLEPELFGMMALVMVLLAGLQLFSDIGLRPSIVQSKRGDDPDFLNTAWTLQVIRGFCLWIVCCAIAFPLAKFYEEPALVWLIPVVGLNSILFGFSSTSLATLNRHMDVKRLAVFQTTRQGLSIIVMIVWAYFSPTIWALVVGNLVSSFLQMVGSYELIQSQKNHFAWDKTALKELFSFGKWIFLATMMSFLASQSDRLILGKLFSLNMLGVYTIAYTLADIPRQIVNKLGLSVVFPLVSKQSDLPRPQLRAKILKQRKLILIGMACFIALTTSFGDWIILSLYDDRYTEAAWMLPLLSLGIWPIVLSETLGRCLNGIGHPQYLAFGSFLKAVFVTVGLPVAFFTLGSLGALVVVAFNDLPIYFVVCYGLWKEKLTGFWQDFQMTGLLILVLATFITGRMALGFDFPGVWAFYQGGVN